MSKQTTQNQIYLDHAATTPVRPEVLSAMLPYFSDKFGNAGSQHQKGYEAKKALDDSRETVAKILNCRESEIIFTGSATEANNLALLGFARANRDKGTHIITTKIEHSSVLNPLKQLEREGFKVTYLDVDNVGLVDPSQLEKALTKDTILVSINYANNEIGTIEPIKELGEICQKHKVTFHTDACQAAGTLTLDTQELNVDMLTLNGSKIYGPKGIGVLFVKKGLNLDPIIFGGEQEKGLRSGTENVAAIVGLAKALELAQKESKKETKRLINLRNKLLKELVEKIPDIILNGPNPFKHPEQRLANNINISIPGISGNELIFQLDNVGIFASTGSTCSNGKGESSHVLTAIGVKKALTYSTIRLTLGKENNEKDIRITLLPIFINIIQRFSQS